MYLSWIKFLPIILWTHLAEKVKTHLTVEVSTSTVASVVTQRTPPTELEVKLVHGRTWTEGLVLLRPVVAGGDDQFNNTSSPPRPWGTICDDGWDDADATVVCRMLGYRAGLARFAPYFGSVSESLPIYLDDLACNGTESNLLECDSASSVWGRNNCDHLEDAGVACLVLDTPAVSLFGFPAVSRRERDEWERAVYIPQPHSLLPWGVGTIIEWAFYIISDTPLSNITLQVWHKQDNDRYQLKGQTVYEGLPTGFHSFNLTSTEQIQFKAGDVLGMMFKNHNPIPFDSSPVGCQRDGGMMYISDRTREVYDVGDVLYFRRKPQSWLACRIYSLYASYIGKDYNQTETISIQDSIYHIETGRRLIRAQAERRCATLYGPRAQLALIETEEELAQLTGALNSLGVSPETYWIGGDVRHAGNGLYFKWGHCQPESGQECILLKKESYATSASPHLYYMFTAKCHQHISFICEIPGLPQTAVLALVLIPTGLLILSVTGIAIYKWRHRGFKRGEAAVGFVHLEDDKLTM